MRPLCGETGNYRLRHLQICQFVSVTSSRQIFDLRLTVRRSAVLNKAVTYSQGLDLLVRRCCQPRSCERENRARSIE